jgi:hypothetical protein
MIQSGGWSNLRTLDEHTKLARVAISFDPRLDEAFRINVAKMRVQLPQQARDQIERAVGPVIKIAQTAYRRQVGLRHVPNAEPTTTMPATAAAAHRRQGDVNSDQPKQDANSKNVRLWTLEELRVQAEKIATKAERPVIRSVFNRLRLDEKDA